MLDWAHPCIPSSIRRPWQVWRDAFTVPDTNSVAAADGSDIACRAAPLDEFESLSTADQKVQCDEISRMEFAAFLAWLLAQASGRRTVAQALADARRQIGLWEEVERAWDSLEDDEKSEWIPADPNDFLASAGFHTSGCSSPPPPQCTEIESASLPTTPRRPNSRQRADAAELLQHSPRSKPLNPTKQNERCAGSGSQCLSHKIEPPSSSSSRQVDVPAALLGSSCSKEHSPQQPPRCTWPAWRLREKSTPPEKALSAKLEGLDQWCISAERCPEPKHAKRRGRPPGKQRSARLAAKVPERAKRRSRPMGKQRFTSVATKATTNTGHRPAGAEQAVKKLLAEARAARARLGKVIKAAARATKGSKRKGGVKVLVHPSHALSKKGSLVSCTRCLAFSNGGRQSFRLAAKCLHPSAQTRATRKHYLKNSLRGWRRVRQGSRRVFVQPSLSR